MEQRSASGWRVLPVPRPKYAFGTGLDAVSCTSGRACTATGSSFSNCGNCLSVKSFAEKWNGTKWSLSIRGRNRAKAASQGGTPSLTGVSCAAPSGCIAVGPARNGVSEVLETFASRWNGNRWSQQTTVNAPGGTGRQGGTLHGVSCISATACIAVWGICLRPPGGELYATLAERWNGIQWTVLPTPTLPDGAGSFGFTLGLNAVSCTSADFCISVGLLTIQIATTRCRWQSAGMAPRGRSRPSPAPPAAGPTRAMPAPRRLLQPRQPRVRPWATTGRTLTSFKCRSWSTGTACAGRSRTRPVRQAR